MIKVRRSIEIGNRDNAMRQWRQKGERCRGGEEVKSSVVDELGGVGVAVRVRVAVWVVGRGEFRGGDGDGEGGEGEAEVGAVGDSAGVRAEGYGCVEAWGRSVLAMGSCGVDLGRGIDRICIVRAALSLARLPCCRWL